MEALLQPCHLTLERHKVQRSYQINKLSVKNLSVENLLSSLPANTSSEREIQVEKARGANSLFWSEMCVL